MEVRYCPKCATELVSRISGERERPTCPACGFVFYFNPVVGAGALIEQEGCVVLVRRGMEPKKGLWCLPAGYVEADELVEEGVAREVWEETGLEIEVDEMLNVYSFGREPQTGVLLVYSGHIVGGDLHAGDDAEEVRFFAPDQLPADHEIAFHTHLEALRDWRRARAIVYRRATPADRRAVEDLDRRHRGVGDGPLGYLEGDDRSLLLAWDGDLLVGIACLRRQAQKRSATIDQVFVDPSYRRWGIATRLVGLAIQESRQDQMRTLLAEAPVTNPVLLVYLKAGFRVSGFIDAYYTAEGEGPTTALYLAYDLAA